MRRGLGLLGLLGALAVGYVLFTAQAFPLNIFDRGSSSAPSRAYRDAPQTGSYLIAPSNEGFATDGRLRWHYSASLFHILLNLRVGGDGAFQGALGIGTDTPTSALHVIGSIATTGTLAMQGGLAVGGVSTPTSSLHVVGSSAITGAAAFQNPVAIGGITTGTSTLHVVGSAAITGSVAFQNPVALGGVATGTSTLHVVGSSTLGGNATLGLSAANTVTLNAAVNTDLLFTADNTRDVGRSGALRPRDTFVARNLHVTGWIHAQAALAYGAHVVTIASNGGAGANDETLAGDRSLYLVDCNDADTCTVTLTESSILIGSLTRIVNISTSGVNITMADSGAHHLAGALTLTPDDVVTLIYVVNRSGAGNWVEISRSAN